MKTHLFTSPSTSAVNTQGAGAQAAQVRQLTQFISALMDQAVAANGTGEDQKAKDARQVKFTGPAYSMVPGVRVDSLWARTDKGQRLTKENITQLQVTGQLFPGAAGGPETPFTIEVRRKSEHQIVLKVTGHGTAPSADTKPDVVETIELDTRTGKGTYSQQKGDSPAKAVAIVAGGTLAAMLVGLGAGAPLLPAVAMMSVLGGTEALAAVLGLFGAVGLGVSAKLESDKQSKDLEPNQVLSRALPAGYRSDVDAFLGQ